MKRRNFQSSLTLLTALLVLAIAVSAGVSLWGLRKVHNQLAHVAAKRSVVDEGKMIAAYLARQPVVTDGDGESGWGEFSRLVSSIHTVENGLQSVSVTRDGVTVFNEQTTGVEKSGGGDLPQVTNLPDIKVDRKVLTVGDETVPVVTFTRDLKAGDGTDRSVEVTLRKNTVWREEVSMSGAIESMFRLSLLTIVVSFSICILLVVLMMHREVTREKQRREEEHLVFAGVLANGVVHDFRNPMSSMRLDVQMLQKEAAKKEQAGGERILTLSNRILGTMDRLDKVFQEFFYLSKPGGDVEERVDLAACIRECVSIMTPGLEQAGVRTELDIPRSGIEVLASPALLQRAIINVVTNARQFSKEGDSVCIRLYVSEGQAVVDVTDSGPGVPASERRRIFDMFITTRPGGTGLGLFLAKTAVEKSGGTIKVLDGPKGGACFRMILPLAR